MSSSEAITALTRRRLEAAVLGGHPGQRGGEVDSEQLRHAAVVLPLLLQPLAQLAGCVWRKQQQFCLQGAPQNSALLPSCRCVLYTHGSSSQPALLLVKGTLLLGQYSIATCLAPAATCAPLPSTAGCCGRGTSARHIDSGCSPSAGKLQAAPAAITRISATIDGSSPCRSSGFWAASAPGQDRLQLAGPGQLGIASRFLGWKTHCCSSASSHIQQAANPPTCHPAGRRKQPLCIHPLPKALSHMVDNDC